MGVNTRLQEAIFSIESLAFDNDVLKFRCVASTSSFLGPKLDKLMEKRVASFMNKEVRWRHSDEPALYVGELVNCEKLDGRYIVDGEIYSDHPRQLEVQRNMREAHEKGDGMGVSLQYIIVSEEKEPIALYIRELSITPDPKCKECTITELNEEDGKMTVEPSGTSGDSKDPWSMFGQNAAEMMHNETASLRDKATKYSEKITCLTKTVETLKNEKTDLEKQIETLTNELKEATNKATGLESKLTIATEKMPVITKIIQLEKVPEDEREKYVKHLTNLDMEALKFELERAEKFAKTGTSPPPQTSTNEGPVGSGDGAGDTDKETPEQFAVRMLNEAGIIHDFKEEK